MAMGLERICMPLILLILQTSVSEARRVAPASLLQTVTNRVSSIHQKHTKGSSPTPVKSPVRRVAARLSSLSSMTTGWTWGVTNLQGNPVYYDTRTGEQTIDKPEQLVLEKGFPPGLEWKVRQVARQQQYLESSKIMQQLSGLRPALQCGSSLLQKASTHTGMGALPGQMLSIGRGAYLHWGIYIGDCNVIQVEAPTNGMPHGSSRISQVTVEQFAAGTELCIQDISDTDKMKHGWSLEDSVKRAKHMLGQTIKYDLFTNNCQHFAYECRTGTSISWTSRVFDLNFNFVANGLSGISDGLVHAFNGTQMLWSLTR